MKKTEEKVIRFIQSQSLLDKSDKVLVALSGGPDSVFLLHFLNKFRKKYQITLAAFHLNHKLRGKNASEDENFCKWYCDKAGIDFFSIQKDIKSFSMKNKISVEEAGRIIRYQLLNKIAKKNRCTKIATAHIKDDNTETVLLNLIKGSGITGMTGIPVKRGNIIRPVLCLTKYEILDYLHSKKISYRLDESNLSDDYERNFLRQQIIPSLKERLNPSLDETVFNSSFIFKSLREFMENQTIDFQNQAIKSGKSELVISTILMKRFHNSIITESLRKSALETFKVTLNFDDINRIMDLQKKQSGVIIELTGNLIGMRDRENIVIRRKVLNKNAEEYKVSLNASINLKSGVLSVNRIKKDKIKFIRDSYIEYISANQIANELIARKWQNGDKFFPLGMSSEKKISDFLIDIKMSRLDKQNQFVLADGEKIIWLIGQRIDNRFKITNETKKVLQLCWKPKKN